MMSWYRQSFVMSSGAGAVIVLVEETGGVEARWDGGGGTESRGDEDVCVFAIVSMTGLSEWIVLRAVCVSF